MVGYYFTVDLASVDRQNEETEMESQQRARSLAALFREKVKHFDDFLWKKTPEEDENMVSVSRDLR